MKKNNDRGFSLVELLVVVIIIAIVAAIAIPNLLASRRAANEASAVSSLRTLHSAQVTFFATAGGGRLYASQALLGVNLLIDPVLGATTGPYYKSGYEFVTTLDPDALAFYCTTAAPQATSSGTNHFGVASAGVIYKKTTPIACTDGVLNITGATPIQ